MKASVIMPPKFFAVFSNREKIRRLSFNQPISRSTMFRRRYASLSNSTGRVVRSSFSFDGITGAIPRFNRYSSIQSARYPLSPPRANGQEIRAPFSSRRVWSAEMRSSSNTDDSCVWPAVRWKPSGRPLPSQRMWILVEKPPRERPNAWSQGSSGSLFFHRPLRTAPPAPSCRRYTTTAGRSRLLQQTRLAVDAESRPMSHLHSIDRTFSSTFSKPQIPPERLAKGSRCEAPIGFRRARYEHPGVVDLSPQAPETHRRSIPNLHHSTINEPSTCPPWR